MAAVLVLAGGEMVAGEVDDQLVDPTKKIILMGGGHRKPNTLLRDLERMEGLATFDGIAIYPPQAEGGATDVIGRLFRTERHRIEDFSQSIADLQAVAARATRLKHNFLLTYLTTGKFDIDPPDWFDPEFDAVIENWRVAAEFCKEGSLEGMMFDDEVYYGADLWSYRGTGIKYHDTKSAAEYADQAFLRGAQIMRAINQVFPDIKILSLHGPAEGRGEVMAAPDANYGLMRAFFDGLLSESTGEAQIIDGFERGYGFRSASDYAAARRRMKEGVRDVSRDPARFEKHFRVAFPFYMAGYRQYGFADDHENIEGMLREEAEGYYYTPDEFEYSLYQAFRHTDEYVWLYTDSKCNWWDRKEHSIYISQAYRDALRSVRERVPELPTGRDLLAYKAPSVQTTTDHVIDAGPISESKKIITYGSGRRNILGFRQDVEWMEEVVAFDGVTLYPALHNEDGTRSEAVGRLFRGERNRIEDFVRGIADLKAAQKKTRRFTDNFLLAYSTSGNKRRDVPDWFDPEFDSVIDNWKVAAEFCRQTDLVGILFSDSVWYGTNLWTYGGSKYEATKTADEYFDQGFLRGAQVMRAINQVHPDINIVFVNGPSESRGATDAAAPFALLRAFVDGLLSECTGAARITDLMGLDYRAAVSFAAARQFAKQTLREISHASEEKFDRHFRLAFGLFLGPQKPFEFSQSKAGSNYYNPEEFEYALHHALRYSDEYVWVFNGGNDWWDKGGHGAFIPQGYREALLAARDSHPDLPALRNPDPYLRLEPGSVRAGIRTTDIAALPDSSGIPRGLAFQQYDEEAIFGDLWTSHEPLLELSSQWRFRADVENTGVGIGWSDAEFDDSTWFLIDSGLPWDDQGYRAYDGYGWYRQKFSVPALPGDRRVHLAFGAVAHAAEVYVNGKLAGQHNTNGWAHTLGDPWKERFLIDVTDLLTEADNSLAVRVVDYGPHGGGIWRPVKLIVER